MSEREILDSVVTMIASLLCADSSDHSAMLGRRVKKERLVETFDAGAILRFAPLAPRHAFLADLGQSREFALNAKLLLHSPQDLLGNQAEIALVAPDCVKWSAFKKLSKRPRNVFVCATGADLYEYHLRFIYQDGRNTYWKRVAAISKDGEPVRTIIEGTRDQGGMPDGMYLILAASMIEDAMRPRVFQATVTDHVSVTFPVPDGDHLDLFRLRDGPYSGNRRKALLHWVAKHVRRTSSDEHAVKAHLRGIHDFEIDGLKVKLEAKPEHGEG